MPTAAASTQNYCLCMAEDGGDFIASCGGGNIKELPFSPQTFLHLNICCHALTVKQVCYENSWNLLSIPKLDYLALDIHQSQLKSNLDHVPQPMHFLSNLINIIQKIIQKSERKKSCTW